MEYSIKKLEKSNIEISITVEKDEWQSDIKRAFEKNKFKYTVEGFRKGKAPMNIVISVYGKGALYEDGIDESLSRCYSEIIKKDSLDICGEPDVDLKEVNEDGLKAVIKVDVKPEFTLGQYKGLAVAMDSVDVTDEELQKVVDEELGKRARLVEKEDGVVANGDIVLLDYSGSVDGVKFDGGTAENQNLEIGSGTFIPGFEEQMIGMKVGESKDINVTFPEEYTPDLAGKAAVFAITVHEISKKELPVLDDEFVKDIDDELNTVEEWKEKLKKDIAEDKASRAESKWENDILDAISAGTEIVIPDGLINDELDYRISEMEQNMKHYGLKFEDYLKYINSSVEQLKEEQREEAVRNVKTRLIIDAILKAEDIKVTPEDIDEEFAKSGEDKKDSATLSRIANKLIIDKLFAFLKDNNDIK